MNSLIIDKSEELVEIVDALIKLKNKSITNKIVESPIAIGSVWSYNKNTRYTCTVKQIHDGCLDVLMSKEWSGEPYYENLIRGFFDDNFTIVVNYIH